MRLAARSTMIAGVLSIAAILAPAASARLTSEAATTRPRAADDLESGCAAEPDQQTSQSTPVRAADPAGGASAQSSRRSTAPRRSERAARSYSPPAGARYSSADTDAYAAFAHPVAASAPTVKAPGAGFDYGAAAVGAGLAVAIIVLITAGGLAVRRRRQPQFG